MFYRDIVAAALQVDPSATIEAITEEVLGFAMPGSGHPGLHRQGAADGPGRDL
jgi:acyl-[acyl-carrier-protein] desaturase